MLSVVTVVRNDLTGLLRTHTSFPSASEDRSFEWVVVDGASTDGTAVWLRDAREDRLHYRSEPDAGIYDAMNRGAAMASGRHVIFLNAGDELTYPGVLSDICAELAPSTDLAFGDAVEVTVDGHERTRPSRDPSWITRGMFTHHQAMVFRRARLLEDGGYRTRYQLSADYDLVARWLTQGASTQRLALPIVRFHLGGRSDVGRRTAIREDTSIRQEVLGMDPMKARGLALAHLAHLGAKRSIPRLVGRWRSARR
jgi:putative colanic acid biosynthesis glycosyltransferase